MPKIKFIKRKCLHCQEVYKFSLERILDGDKFFCPACKHEVPIDELQNLLELVNNYNETIIKLESKFVIEGEAVLYNPKTVIGIAVGKLEIGIPE